MKLILFLALFICQALSKGMPLRQLKHTRTKSQEDAEFDAFVKESMDEAKQYALDNKEKLMDIAKEEGVLKYREMKHKLNMTEEQIEAWTKKFQNQKVVKHAGDLLVLPYLFCIFALVCFQCCICSIPCLYSKGCCCFKKCNGYKKKGTIDKENNEIYILYKDYLKFGIVDRSKAMIIETYNYGTSRNSQLNKDTNEDNDESDNSHAGSTIRLVPLIRSGTLQEKVLNEH